MDLCGPAWRSVIFAKEPITMAHSPLTSWASSKYFKEWQEIKSIAMSGDGSSAGFCWAGSWKNVTIEYVQILLTASLCASFFRRIVLFILVALLFVSVFHMAVVCSQSMSIASFSGNPL